MGTLRLSLSSIFLIALLCIPSFAQDNSPQSTVKEWIKVYGVDQDRASELTTIRFREGRPKKTWADETYRLLREIRFKHLGGTVVDEKTNGIESMVILRSTIETVVGSSEQTELYLLRLVNGKWLIDEMVVGEENVKEKGVRL